ncbi:TLC domain-containing protein [Chaetomium tenue]|uniref:TLC domain-containing protein n=1 Tax=Chaetomium tenue TaxID=1854479 RepID=A0ACB7P408_9PEZI|nr:TLC domain-containing protein [Chaetomium globosum]
MIPASDKLKKGELALVWFRARATPGGWSSRTRCPCPPPVARFPSPCPIEVDESLARILLLRSFFEKTQRDDWKITVASPRQPAEEAARVLQTPPGPVHTPPQRAQTSKPRRTSLPNIDEATMSPPTTPTLSHGNSNGTGNGTAKPSGRAPRRSGKPQHMNGPLYKQANSNVVLVRRVKRKNEGPMKQLTRWFVNNQIGFSFNLLALLFLAHGMPRARDYTAKYFNLSYYNPSTGNYGLGWADGHVVLFSIVLLTGLRAATMEYILAPFAKSQGISKRKDITRFSEQAWMSVYYSFFWPLGLYIYYQSPAYFNLRELWTGWPDRELTGLMKGYMLAQLGFWLQQMVVINIEERRKDHWQMFTHHIVTSVLIYTSYRYGHTRVGNLILVLMDVSDLALGLAKCLKYLGYHTICDVMFGVFMASWLAARHFLYLAVCYSVWAHTPDIMPTGCFKGSRDNLVGPFDPPTEQGFSYLLEPLWDSEGTFCYNETVKWSFLSMLLFLQCLTIMWFFLIVRVAIKVVKGAPAEDVRSDDEGAEVEDEDEFVYEEATPLEEEVGVDEIDLKSWERRSGVKRQGPSTSGVSLPGHSDRKELLGRIGCDKQVE